MAQGLQVGPVPKQDRVATVRTNVVNVRGADPLAVPGALPAVRLPQQLAGAQDLRPFCRAVELVPGGAVCTASGLRPVGRAVSVRDQSTAARVPARSQGLLAQGYHLLAKQKTPETMGFPIRESSWAPAFNALASLDMQNDFGLAVPAPDRERVRLCVWPDPKQAPVAAAHRTGDPAIYNSYSITDRIFSQAEFTPFFSICELFN